VSCRAHKGEKWQTNPDVFFLSESHLDKAKAEKLARKMKFEGVLFHERNGRSGGLVLMWKKEIKIEPKDIKANFIDLVIKGDTDCGEPRWEDKHKSWSYMRELHSQMSIP
jgi:hypothetical protein